MSRIARNISRCVDGCPRNSFERSASHAAHFGEKTAIELKESSEYVRLNLIHANDIATPARVPPNEVDRKLYHHKSRGGTRRISNLLTINPNEEVHSHDDSIGVVESS